MKIRLFGICLLLAWSSLLQSQSIRSVLADKETKEVIPDVFVFLSNSTLGTISDSQGYFELAVGQKTPTILVFSHLNYELLNLPLKDISIADTIFLMSRHLDLEEIVVAGKARPRVRKKRLKKFVDAFLGAQRDAKTIKILNTEVLIFKEENNKLLAETNKPLLIENKLLGYTIKFYLKKFEYHQNGDVVYKGNAFFEPLEGTIKQVARFKKNRRKTYLISSRHFFASLIKQSLKEEEYAFGFSVLNYQREFVNFQPISMDSIQIHKLDTNKYELPIKGFLTITNNLIKLNNKTQAQSAKLTPTLSTGVKNIKQQPRATATSFLRSTTDKITVDKYGRILNALDIEEYGYWANIRVASLLPFDYEF